ncbi:MAG: restriction endonuclease subunit S [Burkholderiaceae bacterium]|nr:restriction endonuclease subunit S [Burkholderiaceae bacterium]
MSSEWKTVEISSICEGIFDGPHATPKKTERGPVFLGISSLNSGQLNLSDLEYLSEEDFLKWTKRVTPQEGDLVFSYETRLGQIAIIPDGLRCCLGRRMALMRIDLTKAIPEYVLYAYLAPQFQDEIRKRTIHGSTVDRIPLVGFGTFPISIPSLNTQKQIVGILKSIDDRITLLRETNTTLEAIAQALFKSWFVDFDPVHAKQQGREPEGMDASTAALFPDSFEESELGLVPMGWRVGTLADVTTVKGGFAYKSEAFGSVGSPVVKIKNIIGDGTVDLLDAQFIAADMAEKTKRFALVDGDIVIAMTGATIGKTGVVITEKNQIPYLNQRVAKFEPNSSGNQNSWFVFVAFQNSSIFDQVVNTASGSAQPNISTSGIESVRLVLPSSHELLKAFDNIAAQLFKGWIANQKQIQTLANLRDTLLPRLISGQLRLPDSTPA